MSLIAASRNHGSSEVMRSAVFSVILDCESSGTGVTGHLVCGFQLSVESKVRRFGTVRGAGIRASLERGARGAGTQSRVIWYTCFGGRRGIMMVVLLPRGGSRH